MRMNTAVNRRPLVSQLKAKQSAFLFVSLMVLFYIFSISIQIDDCYKKYLF